MIWLLLLKVDEPSRLLDLLGEDRTLALVNVGASEVKCGQMKTRLSYLCQSPRLEYQNIIISDNHTIMSRWSLMPWWTH